MSRALLERRLIELERRRRAGRRLHRLLSTLALALGAAAAATIAIRVALPAAESAALWVTVAAAALPLCVAPWLGGPRERSSQIAARLDVLTAAHGLVMGLAATPPDAREAAWIERGDRVLTRVTWPRRDLSRAPLAALAAAAAIAALLLPQRAAPIPDAPPPPWEVHFERAEARIAQLDTLGAAPDDTRARLAEQLDRLRDHAARSGMSQAAWDGLDRLDRDLDRAVEEARQRLAEAIAATRTAAAPRAGDLTPDEDAERRRRERDRLRPPDRTSPSHDDEATDRDAGERHRLLERLTRERESERREHLAERLAELARSAPGLAPALSPEAAAAMRELLGPEALRADLGPEARAALDELLRRAAESDETESDETDTPGATDIEHARTIDAETVARALEELARALSEGEAKLGQLGGPGGELDAIVAGLARGLLSGEGDRGASGGPGRGGAAGALVLGGSRDGDVVEVGALAPLPPGARRNADGSVTLAQTARDPELDPRVHDDRARGALRDHADAAADARRARVSPRHRGAVGRYFRPEP